MGFRDLDPSLFDRWSELRDPAVWAMTRGKQIMWGALCYDDAPKAGSEPIVTVESCNHKSMQPVHAVIFRSYSLLERVISLSGNSDCDLVHFDCPLRGQDQRQFDIEEWIPPAFRSSGPITGEVVVCMRRQEATAERSVKIQGNVDVVRGRSDQVVEKYEITLRPT